MTAPLPADKRTDHDRGCEGRQYTCSCGYDDERDAEIKRLEREVSRLMALMPEHDTRESYRCTECGAFHLQPRKFVKVDTEDGQVVVEACPDCGMLDPDLNPLHADGCPPDRPDDEEGSFRG